METPTPQEAAAQNLEQKVDMLLKINGQIHRYLKWQLYITIALVVLPLLAALIAVPFALRSVTNIYGSAAQF
jgi:hypothetical protein